MSWRLGVILSCVLPLHAWAGWPWDTPVPDGSPPSYCGIYSLYAASVLLGREIPFEELVRSDYIGSPEGSTAAELRRAATDHGLSAAVLTGLNGAVARSVDAPLILHVRSSVESPRYDHWVLLLGDHDGQARIVNPPGAVRLVPWPDVEAVWDGVAIAVTDRPLGGWRLLAAARWEAATYVAVAGGIWLVLLLARRWARKLLVPGAMASVREQPVIIGVALCAALAWALAAEDGFLRYRQAVTGVLVSHAGDVAPRLSLRAMRERAYVQGEQVLIVDARWPDDFARGHIPGAINLPVNLEEGDLSQQLQTVPRGREVVVYCQSAGCSFAAHVAGRLLRLGFRNVAVYPGGWREWQEAHP